MFGQWLLPYNEIVAQWVDPFYDAGADSHTSIMGNIGKHATRGGFSAAFYNGSFEDDFGSDYGALAFNRRQDGVVQYVWPNTGAMADQSRDGFQFRAAVTEGSDTDDGRSGNTLDPRIFSTGVSWQQNLANGGQVWLAAAYEDHEDISVTGLGGLRRGDVFAEESQKDLANFCDDSSDEGIRLAGRYSHDWGNGQRTMLAAMWEELDYDADGCDSNVTATQRTNGASADGGLYAGGNDDYDIADADGSQVQGVWTDVERDAWMISGKHSFGNGFDVRFSYMDADEWDCGSDSACTSDQEKNTGAEAYNLGLFYTMPAGTELRLTYSEVDNESKAGYDFGINVGGSGVGEDVDMIAVGIVHWFD